MSFTNWLEEDVLTTYFSDNANTELACFTSVTDEDTPTFTEVSGGAYARQSVDFGAPSQVSGKATSTNAADVTFPAATADWGTVTHVGVYDTVQAQWLAVLAVEGGSGVTINNGSQLKFPAGDLTITQE